MLNIIALDIDGVVANFLSEVIKYWGEPQVPYVYSLEEMFPSVSDEDLAYWIKLPQTYTRIEPFPEALEAIDILLPKWQVMYITSRPFSPTMQRVTIDWLTHHHILFPVYFASNKKTIVNLYRCGASVEDNLTQAKEIAVTMETTDKRHKSFLLDRPYNSGSCAPAVRVYSWNEIIDVLMV